ncbi:MAG: EamA family transporter [Deltaproteobacteria bacterium]|nr:EamA family transporter [Deltaproteobacteria bacterium]MBW1951888.1 EamA family transporter [Deltaproteobacteria bacterium]MBW1986970.1 EamA family transporter [Deltaproteobacteria bacterium]MBW2134485.1 EamA family transporter [Deltaproteobacteria bacterium]
MTKTLLTLIIAVISVSIGDVLLSHGMKQIGAVSSYQPHALLKLGVQIFSHPTIILGILCLAVFFFLWLAVLSWSDLSFALPLTALSYVLTAFLAQYLLEETVTPIRWAGTVLICMGVALVTKSGY